MSKYDAIILNIDGSKKFYEIGAFAAFLENNIHFKGICAGGIGVVNAVFLSLSDIDNLIKFSKDNNLICNVKSNVSLISNGKEIIFNTNGNPCLAKGGSGDILSGIITGVSNKTNDLLKNVALGSYILGRASELCVRKLNENFVIGSDIINKLNDVLNELSISL